MIANNVAHIGHDDDRHTCLCHQRREFGVGGQSTDVIDNACPGCQRLAGDRATRGVDRDGYGWWNRRGDGVDRRYDAINLLGNRYRRAPGREDAPPTSIICAPAATWSNAWRAAWRARSSAARPGCARPSPANESGVILTMPMIQDCRPHSQLNSRQRSGAMCVLMYRA